ncbi:MAG TPA: hypothetical protein VIH75_13805 [Candidatus Sulfotelmatobacter sp.]|jgi:hypothetical protein
MTRKPDAQEPLLNTVARKLGQAAGTLANMTHLLTKEQATRASRAPANPGSDEPESSKSSVKKEKTPVKVDRKQSRGQSQKRTRSARARTASRGNAASGTKPASNKKGPQAR